MRSRVSPPAETRLHDMPPFTLALIAANLLVYALSMLTGGVLDGWLALWPAATGLFRPWQPVTYAFVHADPTHLGFNMLGLWMFGADLERLWGWRRFGAFYAVSVLVGAATQMAVTLLLGSNVPTVGASGGLFGLLIGFAMVFPHRKVVPLIPPIPMPAWLFVTLYGLIELTLGVTGAEPGVAHFVHLGGLLGGWLVMRYWRGRPPFGWRRP